MTEDEATEIAWQANVDRVQNAKRELRAAVRRQAAIEGNIVRACGRRRFPTPDELEQIDEAKAVTSAARAEHEAAKAHFKLGVTADQLASVLAGES